MRVRQYQRNQAMPLPLLPSMGGLTIPKGHHMLDYRFDIIHTTAAETLAETTYDAIVSLCNTHLIPLDSTCIDLHSLTQYLARQGYEFRQRDYHPSPYHF